MMISKLSPVLCAFLEIEDAYGGPRDWKVIIM